MSLKIEIGWVSDPEGDGEFYRLCVSGDDTHLAILDCPEDASLAEILRAACAALGVQRPMDRDEVIVRMVRQGLRQKDIAAVVELSESQVQRISYRLGLGREERGRPPKG